MSMNNKGWLSFALELYEKVKELGLNQNLGKKELETLVDLASKFNVTGQSHPQTEEEKIQPKAGLIDSANEENNTFWQQESGPTGGGISAPGALKGAYAPPISIYETAGGINVHVILPGITSRDDLTLLLSRDTLELSGARGVGAIPAGGKEKEDFFRTVHLPAPVEPSGATAIYRNGYLYISAPKKNRSTALKIEVKFE